MDTNSSVRISPRKKVFDWLESSIASGELGSGSEIPSERNLAEVLGVARNTVGAALKEAEQSGLLVRRSPAARKRFVADGTSGTHAPLNASTVFVISELSPFLEEEAPRWSDRFLSLDLLTRLTATGKHVMVLNEDMLTDKDIDALFRSSPGGVIITSTIGEHAYTYKIIDMCKAQKIPLVVYGNHPAVSECDRVYTDHMRGSKEITEWLISKGCRKILPFFPLQPSKNWEKMRIQGYTEAMTAAGLEVRECAWHGIKDVPETPLDAEFNIGRALAFEKLSELQENNGFDAIMCQTDHFAKIVISALRQLGFIPNKDVLVAGYDNVMPDLTYDPFESEYSIVTIDKRNDKIANEMAKLLVERISGDLPDEPQCRTNSHELVVRDQSV